MWKILISLDPIVQFWKFKNWEGADNTTKTFSLVNMLQNMIIEPILDYPITAQIILDTYFVIKAGWNTSCPKEVALIVPDRA